MEAIKKHLLFLLYLLGTFQSAWAQDIFTIQREDKRVHSANLRGKGGVVFKTSSADLVITTGINSDPTVNNPVKVQDGYEYRMAFDISDGYDSRVFTIALKDTLAKEKIGQINLYANETVYINVKVVKNLITMESAPDGSHFIAEGNGWALIEFNSLTPLNVQYHDDLQGYRRRGRSRADVYVDSLIINVKEITQLNEQISILQSEIAEIGAHYETLLETKSDAEIRKMENVKEMLLAKKEERLNAITHISLKGDDTNRLIVNREVVKGLVSKGKLRFNVSLQNTKRGYTEKLPHNETAHDATPATRDELELASRNNPQKKSGSETEFSFKPNGTHNQINTKSDSSVEIMNDSIYIKEYEYAVRLLQPDDGIEIEIVNAQEAFTIFRKLASKGFGGIFRKSMKFVVAMELAGLGCVSIHKDLKQMDMAGDFRHSNSYYKIKKDIFWELREGLYGSQECWKHIKKHPYTNSIGSSYFYYIFSWYRALAVVDTPFLTKKRINLVLSIIVDTKPYHVSIHLPSPLIKNTALQWLGTKEVNGEV